MHSNSTFSLYLDTLSSVRKKPRIGTFLSDSRQQPTKTDWLTDWLTNIIGRTDGRTGRQAGVQQQHQPNPCWLVYRVPSSQHPATQPKPRATPVGSGWKPLSKIDQWKTDFVLLYISFFATVHIFYRRGPMGPFCFFSTFAPYKL